VKLRSYQQRSLDRIHAAFEQSNSTLLVLATGLGKTIIFSHLAKDYIEKGQIMVLAHREELVGQAWRHLNKITSVEPDTEMGDYHAATWGAAKSDIIVGTIQTQVSGRDGFDRMTKFNPDDFSLLVIDEAHHAAADSYRKVIEYYRRNPNLKVLGVTATPDRADEKALGQIFESVADEYEIADAINDGWLVDIVQRSVYVDGLDYSSVKTVAGDLNGADLARVLEVEKILHEFAAPTIELAGDMKTLIFAASLFQAERLCEIINRHKPNSARWVHGGTPKEERRELWPAYTRGDFQFLINVGITTEGWDEPGVECIVLARPTKSRSLFAQMIGRGTRSLPNVLTEDMDAEARKFAIRASAKPYLTVLDFVGNAGRHKLVTPADILGQAYDDIEVDGVMKSVTELANKLAAEKSEQTGQPVLVSDELDEAQRQLLLEAERAEEERKRAGLTVKARYSTAQINPFKVYDMAPWREREWNKGREPTPKQLEFLTSRGVDPSGLSFTHASQLIDRIVKDSKLKLASFKQVKILKRFGYETENMSKKEASEIITTLAANNWKRETAKQKD